jgi:hypothetical protein
MTVLPTVRGQLLTAAARRSTGAHVPPARRRLPRVPSLPRPSTLLPAVSVAVALAVAAVAVVLLHGAPTADPAGGGPSAGQAHRAPGSPSPPASLIGGPVHLPALRPGARCPATSGHRVHNRYFTGMVLGNGPVRVLLADRGDLRHGRVDLGRSSSHSMHAIQTLWIATPSLPGPFEIRGGRLGRSGRIEVKPGADGLTPGSGPLVVPRGATVNTFPNGDRTVPGSTWVSSPGCYAWEVDASHFSDVIVFQALAPPRHR